LTAFWEGVIAGLGIAVPFGAIAILIVEMGMRRGFLPGFMAGAAAASVDFFFAGLAVLAGETLVRELTRYVEVLRLGSAVVLLIIGGLGIWRARKIVGTNRVDPIIIEGNLRIYLKFFMLTFINPMTVIYFSALILGRGVNNVMTTGERIAFIGGAGLASLSWQTFLAVVGTMAGRNLSSRFQMFASLLGNFVVVGFGLRILLQVLL
jgi:arginine exporter protein ArgO